MVFCLNPDTTFEMLCRCKIWTLRILLCWHGTASDVLKTKNFLIHNSHDARSDVVLMRIDWVVTMRFAHSIEQSRETANRPQEWCVMRTLSDRRIIASTFASSEFWLDQNCWRNSSVRSKPALRCRLETVDSYVKTRARIGRKMVWDWWNETDW